jgi:hypothetical protein
MQLRRREKELIQWEIVPFEGDGNETRRWMCFMETIEDWRRYGKPGAPGEGF